MVVVLKKGLLPPILEGLLAYSARSHVSFHSPTLTTHTHTHTHTETRSHSSPSSTTTSKSHVPAAPTRDSRDRLAFVHEQSLPACAQVSKTWHQASIPHIWKDVELSNDKMGALTAIQSHSHLVRSLAAIDSIQELVSLQCPNILSLAVAGPVVEKSTELIFNHPIITHLTLGSFHPSDDLVLWDSLLGFHHLKNLKYMIQSFAGRE